MPTGHRCAVVVLFDLSSTFGSLPLPSGMLHGCAGTMRRKRAGISVRRRVSARLERGPRDGADGVSRLDADRPCGRSAESTALVASPSSSSSSPPPSSSSVARRTCRAFRASRFTVAVSRWNAARGKLGTARVDAARRNGTTRGRSSSRKRSNRTTSRSRTTDIHCHDVVEGSEPTGDEGDGDALTGGMAGGMAGGMTGGMGNGGVVDGATGEGDDGGSRGSGVDGADGMRGEVGQGGAGGADGAGVGGGVRGGVRGGVGGVGGDDGVGGSRGAVTGSGGGLGPTTGDTGGELGSSTPLFERHTHMPVANSVH